MQFCLHASAVVQELTKSKAGTTFGGLTSLSLLGEGVVAHVLISTLAAVRQG